MKFSFFKTLIISFLVLAMLISMTNCDPVPYTANYKKGLASSAYEGFGNKNIEYTTYPANVAVDSNTQNSINANADSFVKVGTYYGLLSSPSSAPKKLDVFLDTPPTSKCISSGLTNTAGPLCLTDEQYTLLSTRGGNIG
jgi:hypothetical protein